MAVRGVGDNLKMANANWNFEHGVAENFDQHVRRSVPFYEEGHKLISRVSDYFIYNDSICYELGCSTGELTLALAKHNAHKPAARFVAIDSSNEMIAQAEAKLQKEAEPRAQVEFIQDNVLSYSFAPADLIASYYTLQFVRPSEKQILVDKVYQALKWGGGFLLFEKVRACDARFQDMMTGLYTDYKLEQGYSGEEIVAKARSLKGALEPFSTNGNLEILKRAGFVDIISIFKYVCFEGFLAIK
ncbi:MAG: methyltransferase domain-containing protein [Deltaproteobacteria bacterium]|nr:methyltransferase domain-containing protein [Deltaproteobacteria bacterium]